MDTTLNHLENWIGNGEALELAAEERHAEIRPHQKRAADPHLSRYLRSVRLAQECAVDIAIANLMINWCV